MMGGDRRAKLAGAVERQLCAEHFGQCAEDRPVFPRVSGREDGALAELYAAFKVHPGSGLFGIGGTRQDHIGAVRCAIPMMADIDFERAPECRKIRRSEEHTSDLQSLMLISYA